ncbi:unnamed protein product [Toxocara canis]|uniref:DNA/RNA-binding protein Alba-like domain-containing protein n=1 Tax=Toxocara canis TaxID=6265 RepID=A0A3P7H8F1_TOXCA|nr:unnamed protein product [Toxocara canis]
MEVCQDWRAAESVGGAGLLFDGICRALPLTLIMTMQTPQGRVDEQLYTCFRHTSMAAQRSRIQQLLDSDVDEVILHGIGSAVSRTVNLALQIQRKLANSVKLNVRTSTIRVNLFTLFQGFYIYIYIFIFL